MTYLGLRWFLQNWYADIIFALMKTIAANDVMFAAYVDYYARKVAACSKSIYCATVRRESLQYAVRLDTLLARVKVAFAIITS